MHPALHLGSPNKLGCNGFLNSLLPHMLSQSLDLGIIGSIFGCLRKLKHLHQLSSIQNHQPSNHHQLSKSSINVHHFKKNISPNIFSRSNTNSQKTMGPLSTHQNQPKARASLSHLGVTFATLMAACSIGEGRRWAASQAWCLIPTN